MGCGFDEPSLRQYASYAGGTSRERYLRSLLREEMELQGFKGIEMEWWHFDFGNPLWAHYTGQDHALYGASHWQDSAAAAI